MHIDLRACDIEEVIAELMFFFNRHGTLVFVAAEAEAFNIPPKCLFIRRH